jgi:regulator of sirC expression with transglutaminase-like and TPR domain
VALLADSEGFTGDGESYDSPDNADLIAVLRRRLGIPISLSILYVALARRMGWQADILGLPGHVLVAIGSRTSHVLIDPFADGRPVDAAGVKAIVERALGRQTIVSAAHVEPLGNRAILVRLLMNQASRARRSGDAPRALTLYRRMTLIAPDLSSLWWERARLERLAGDIEAARRSLAAMRETTHDPVVAGRIRAAVEALAR